MCRASFTGEKVIRFQLDPKLNVLITVAEGSVSFHEIMRHIEKETVEGCLANPELFDAREASTDLTPGQVRALVTHLRWLMRDHVLGRTAIVTEDRVAFGMSRMLEMISEFEGGPEIRVFHALQPGLQWLAEHPSG